MPDNTSAAGFALEFHDDGAGLLYVALADDTQVSGDGALLTVRLRLSSNVPQDASAPLALAAARLNDVAGRDFATSALQRDVGRQNGQINIEQQRIYLPIILRQ